MSVPKKWWQWFLVYPTLLISLMGALPEASRIIETGAAWGETVQAQEQHEMWKSNFNCTKTVTPVTIHNVHNIVVSSLVCPSGDILITGQRPEDKDPTFMWVSLDNVLAGDTSSMLDIFPKAYAYTGTNYQSPYRIICQRWVSRSVMYTRIHTGGMCYDQYFDTYLNVVTSSNTVNCNSPCK